MNLTRTLAVSLIALTAFGFSTAQAGIEEFRIGIAKHDVELTGDDPRESGVNIQPQIVFTSPDFLSFIASPNPYLIASINSDGETNFAGGGLLYKRDFGQTDWFWELDGGLVYQDGRTDLPPPIEAAERERILATEITFGSELQFHFVAGVGKAVSDKWDIQAYFEHLSHGQILGDTEKNEGVENVGLKFGRRFR
ncbi:MAG: acyloxyacyl hydrolase [Aquisalinus sp.]|nr:acyloxyacyl hydrolase [Aquisalinus sp.]